VHYQRLSCSGKNTRPMAVNTHWGDEIFIKEEIGRNQFYLISFEHGVQLSCDEHGKLTYTNTFWGNEIWTVKKNQFITRVGSIHNLSCNGHDVFTTQTLLGWEKWDIHPIAPPLVPIQFEDMSPGDHIAVERNWIKKYYHHFIVENENVIEYTTKDQVLQIIRSPKKNYQNCQLYRVEWNWPFKSVDTETVISRAKSRIGESNYNLFRGNCEHFASWCKVGVSQSAQVTQNPMYKWL